MENAYWFKLTEYGGNDRNPFLAKTTYELVLFLIIDKYFVMI